MIKVLFQNKRLSLQQSSFLWNMCGGMINAFQSVILLMVITRVLGLYEAGLFTIAYANANLFLTIGKYGMRNYQVTDVNQQFNFREYLYSRYVTCFVMIVVSVVYVLFTGYARDYSLEKILIILFMCFLKVLDSMEDIYLGFYQRKGRLDVASKIMTCRLLITLGIFIAGMCILKDLLTALIVSVIVSFLAMVILIRGTYPYFSEKTLKVDYKNVKKLIMVCFPLFMGTFLSFYIGNAPKYAIDAQMTDEIQACYGFIAMPVFVINLLNSFIFQPILTQLAVEWNEKKYVSFIKKILIECGIVVVITAAALIGGYLLGIPVLSWLYNTDLAPYKAELLILLVGGGLLALSGFLVIVLTIIRMQRDSVWGYLITAVLAWFLSPVMVQKFGVMGAASLYTILMGVLSFIFVGMIVFKIRKACKKN